ASRSTDAPGTTESFFDLEMLSEDTLERIIDEGWEDGIYEEEQNMERIRSNIERERMKNSEYIPFKLIDVLKGDFSIRNIQDLLWKADGVSVCDAFEYKKGGHERRIQFLEDVSVSRSGTCATRRRKGERRCRRSLHVMNPNHNCALPIIKSRGGGR
ncbi:hypothetical protein PENTCL1PPCAC_25083, partial [Pristionchus entomophagus]